MTFYSEIMTDDKSLLHCAELALMHSTLRAVADMTRWAVACSFKNSSGMLPAGGTLIAL